MTTVEPPATVNGLATIAQIREQFTLNHFPPAVGVSLTPEAARVQAMHYQDAPDAPEAVWRPSYDALTVAIIDQWHALIDNGFLFVPWTGQKEPYATSDAMRADLESQVLFYLPTAATGGLPVGHPMGETVLVRTRPHPASLTCILLNDVFRAVHDALGHGSGASFGPNGERRAWAEHRSTLPSQAHLALWNETTAQNLWTNFGPHMWGDHLVDQVYLSDLPLRDRPFARQRIVNPPKEWL